MGHRSLLAAVLLMAPILCSAQEGTGSYTFQVKDGESPEAELVANGVLVLMNDTVPTDKLPGDLLEASKRDSRWLLAKTAPSACFGFETSVKEVDGRAFYGGIIPAGLTTWKERGDTIAVKLYQSPDAWMTLKGKQEGDRISGVVRQREFYGGKVADGLPFEAERTGPASIDACTAALRKRPEFDRE